MSVCSGECVLRCVCNPVCVFLQMLLQELHEYEVSFISVLPLNPVFLSNIPTSVSPDVNAAACLNPACGLFSPRCVCRSSRNAGAGMESSLSEALKTG